MTTVLIVIVLALMTLGFLALVFLGPGGNDDDPGFFQ